MWFASNQGLSLVGVLVAIALLLAGIVAVTQLVSQGQMAAGMAEQTFVAVNLAREGLELARAARDSDWFAEDTDWALAICDTSSSAERTLIIEADEAFGSGVFIAEVAVDSDQTRLWREPDGRLTHIDSGQDPSLFRRQLVLDCSTRDADPALVTVASEVRWESRGQSRIVALQAQLYDWYVPGL